MLDTINWDALGRLVFAGRRSADGLNPGLHASQMRASGVEFHEYRPYCPGDDAGQIDWKLFGRTDRYYLRRSRSPVDRSAYVLIDRSASMGFPDSATAERGGDAGGVTKLQYAAALAAAAAYVILRQSDRVGMGLFADRLTGHAPPSKDPGQFGRILDRLRSIDCHQGRGDTGRCIGEAHRLMKQRGLLVLITDLLDPLDPVFRALHAVRQTRSEVVVFQVLSNVELGLVGLPAARLRVVDPETLETRGVDGPDARARYLRKLRAHQRAAREGCRRIGAGYHLFNTTDPLVASLGAFLRGTRATRTAATG